MASTEDGLVFLLQRLLEQSQNATSRVILIHDLESTKHFPSLPSTYSDLQPFWNTIAIPLISTYSIECWERIIRKLRKLESPSNELVLLLYYFYIFKKKSQSEYYK